MSWPSTKSLLFVVGARLLVALWTTGFFQPDEYFQALEPAHRAVFGYGHLTWEWTAHPPIRSFVYPALFVPVYALVKRLGYENTELLIWAPRFVQVAFAALGDVALYVLASSLLTEQHGIVSLFLSLISPFNTLALTRTLSNSTETNLTTMALAFWPFPSTRSRSRTRVALTLAASSCLFRPTAAILWAFLGLELVWRWKSSILRIANLAFDVALVGTAALALGTAIDSVYYGTLTFTPIAFLQTNVFTGTSHFYGVNAIHYYFTQGLPIVLGPTLPFTLHGAWIRANRTTGARSSALSILLGLVVWTLSVYSCLAHKEWRFIHPLLPVLHIFAADSLINLKVNLTKSSLPSVPKWSLIRPVHLAFLLVASLPLNLYLVRMHGSAQITAARYLHSLGQDTSRVKSIGVLMPCHSIPWQSYIHLPHLEQGKPGTRLWALGCEPPLGLNSTRLPTYASQTDVFFDTLGPITYFDTYFPQSVDPSFPPSIAPCTLPGHPPPKDGWNHTWPSHLLMFGTLERITNKKLRKLGYKDIWRIRNGWEDDERRRGGVVVWEWTGDL